MLASLKLQIQGIQKYNGPRNYLWRLRITSNVLTLNSENKWKNPKASTNTSIVTPETWYSQWMFIPTFFPLLAQLRAVYNGTADTQKITHILELSTLELLCT